MAIGHTVGIEKDVNCTVAIATRYTIAKPGATDELYTVATAATENLVGVWQETQATAGARCKLMITGISSVLLGGTVTRGDYITSDANAKGVKAVIGNNVIGFCTKSGVSGDIVPVVLTQYMVAPTQTQDGLGVMGVARATYDFAVDGGAVSSIGLGVTIPDNAIIVGGVLDIVTAFTSTGGTGTIALDSEGAGDLLAAVDADTLSGVVALIPVWTAATAIKMTAANELTITIATAAITAGKAVLFVQYVVSD